MIRKLCFVLIGVLMFCGTANANVIVDNFINGASQNIKSENIDRGSGFTSDLLFVSIPGSADVNFQSEGYVAGSTTDFTNGDQMVFTYSDFNGVGATLGAASGMTLSGLSIPIAPIPTSQWSLLIGGAGFNSVGPNPINASGNLIYNVPNLSNATTLTLTFTYVGGPVANNLTFGGPGTDFVALEAPAIPEPTTLLMLGSVVACGLTHRRRRK